jgi:hypothetical protein
VIFDGFVSRQPRLLPVTRVDIAMFVLWCFPQHRTLPRSVREAYEPQAPPVGTAVPGQRDFKGELLCLGSTPSECSSPIQAASQSSKLSHIGRSHPRGLCVSARRMPRGSRSGSRRRTMRARTPNWACLISSAIKRLPDCLVSLSVPKES